MTTFIKDLLTRSQTNDENTNIKSRGGESLKEVWDWEDKHTALAGKRAVAATTASSDAGSFLSDGVEINGRITCKGALVINGTIEGEIYSGSTLTIGQRANVHGDIKAKDVTISGSVHGNIAAAGRCELKSTSAIRGDLKAARLIIEEGATFIGRSEVSRMPLRPEVLKHQPETRKEPTPVAA